MATRKSKRLKRGKWGMWKFFASVNSVRPHLPPTQVLTKSSLRLFLSTYPAIYVKPNYGQQGRDVFKVWKAQKNNYEFIREKGKAVHCKSIDELYNKLKSRRKQIVQRSIDLAKIDGRPFDMRVLMMRDGNGQWQYVGMLAKVAGPDWIITNKRSKGNVLTVGEALYKSLEWNSERIRILQRDMIQLGYDICTRFDDDKRLHKQVGIDLGIDTEGKLWIIEENVAPGWTLFAKLRDKTMYNRIHEILSKRKKSG